MFCFHAYDLVSPKLKKKNHHIIFSYNKEKFQKNICISMHFSCNNKFVRAMRTMPIFQKF